MLQDYSRVLTYVFSRILYIKKLLFVKKNLNWTKLNYIFWRHLLPMMLPWLYVMWPKIIILLQRINSHSCWCHDPLMYQDLEGLSIWITLIYILNSYPIKNVITKIQIPSQPIISHSRIKATGYPFIDRSHRYLCVLCRAVEIIQFLNGLGYCINDEDPVPVGVAPHGGQICAVHKV